MTALIDGIGKIAGSFLSSSEDGQERIAEAILELAPALRDIADAIISTVKDENLLRHYGHLEAAIRAIEAAKHDNILLPYVENELNHASRYQESGLYWHIKVQFELLSNRLNPSTVRKFLAYIRSDNSVNNERKILLLSYVLFICKDEGISNSIVMGILDLIKNINISSEDLYNLTLYLISAPSINSCSKEMIVIRFIDVYENELSDYSLDDLERCRFIDLKELSCLCNEHWGFRVESIINSVSKFEVILKEYKENKNNKLKLKIRCLMATVVVFAFSIVISMVGLSIFNVSSVLFLELYVPIFVMALSSAPLFLYKKKVKTIISKLDFLQAEWNNVMVKAV